MWPLGHSGRPYFAKANPGPPSKSRGSRRSTYLLGGWQRSDSTIVPESAVVLKRVRGYRIVLRTASFREIPAQPVDTWRTAECHRRFRARPSVDAEHEFFAPAPTCPQHRATERDVHRRVFLRRVEREGRLRPTVSADVAHVAGQSSPMSSHYLICSRVRHRLGVPAPIFFRQCGNAPRIQAGTTLAIKLLRPNGRALTSPARPAPLGGT